MHLIVLSPTKNPLFDAYFNRVTALLTVRFLSVMRAYLRPFARFALIFSFAVRAYLGPSALFALIFYIFRVRKNISDNALFGFRRPYFEFFFPFYKTKKLK